MAARGSRGRAQESPAQSNTTERATESGPREWESHGRLGAFLCRQGRYTQAIASFDKMRELAPDHTRAYSNLAAAYQVGRTDEAAKVLQRALEIAPDSMTYSNLGSYLYFQGKYPEAVRAFDEAVKLNANAYLRWGNLGDAVRMTAPDSDKMHESYRRAVQLARGDWRSVPPIPASRAVLPCIWSATARPPLGSPRSIRCCGCRPAAVRPVQRRARRGAGEAALAVAHAPRSGARRRLPAARDQRRTRLGQAARRPRVPQARFPPRQVERSAVLFQRPRDEVGP